MSVLLRNVLEKPQEKKLRLHCLGVVALMSSLLLSMGAQAKGEVNIYSARQESLIKPVLDTFSAENDVVVNLITGSADALLSRLKAEGDASPADIFITVDAGRLHRAKMAGVLQAINSDILNTNIPSHLRDSEGYWFGLSQRARVIFYNPEKVSVKDLSTYEDLANPRWKGRICVRSSANVYNQSLVASMLEADGREKTQAWIKGLVSNLARPPFGGDVDLLKAVAAGVCDLTLANTYYFGRLGQSDKAEERDVYKQLKLFWPNQGEDERGAHVNVSGAGVTAAATNIENATLLLEFLSNHASQEWYAHVNNEYPVVSGVGAPEMLAPFGAFRADTISLSQLGENNRQAVELMDIAGWK
ncbi:Fe(3+) ABC transporter substrate-binding protein [Marinomonas sp. KJ51-3]|uniref:Fe(3+) ABC transporter substrate-binding protein n=2 Tax=Oceanospirillaceae TaxID=135620 RepID=A0ABT3KDF2_9GAMM|nr:Fe(3+) ABC transporter substrate-binding protein [Marinomonas sp. KJ51-3]MCW4628570.1 Fe(3+) ABC transporter substrate-binding protein [Marinomonas sp. KJ51-3]